MGTPHLEAEKGDIAESVLLPGDPLRAKFIAENFLDNPVCYNQVRGMLGYTGTYKGKKVSVQGTGMGIPSISIYVNELISQYSVKNLIRIGTCGSIQKSVKIRDVILALSASTDSSINKNRFGGLDYAPTADFELLNSAWKIAKKNKLPVKAGPVFTSDSFYGDDSNWWKIWAEFGIITIEMETAGLYTLAAKYKVHALSLLTVSDSILTGEATSSQERQETFNQMIELALETIYSF
ncbi:MAG: purine-nucleoside phosphorylase [Spirochaetaceae bacterium]|nr:purine-nucleoside phosphorylase [Spirochaetaceae bacterium]